MSFASSPVLLYHQSLTWGLQAPWLLYLDIGTKFPSIIHLSLALIGARLIPAGSETLHDTIHTLIDRVRQLEGALESMQSKSESTATNQTHPLLRQELLQIKLCLKVYDPSSVLSSGVESDPQIQDEAKVPDDHESDGALSFCPDQPVYAATSRPEFDEHDLRSGSTYLGISPDILRLSTTFPFPWVIDIGMRERIRDALPLREEADRLCEQARKHALWQ